MNRLTRTAAAAVAAGLAVIALSGCAPQTPEGIAGAQYDAFVNASRDGGEPPYCSPDSERPILPSEKTDADLEINVGGEYNDQPDKVWVNGTVVPADGAGWEGEERVSIVVRIVDGEEPCITSVLMGPWQ